MRAGSDRDERSDRRESQSSRASMRAGSCPGLGAARLAAPCRSARVTTAAVAREDPRLGAQPARPCHPSRLTRQLADHFPWHFLNFLPEPHQQGSFLPGSLLGAVEEVGRPFPLVRVVVVFPAPVFVVCVFSSCSACSAVLTVTRKIV